VRVSESKLVTLTRDGMGINNRRTSSEVLQLAQLPAWPALHRKARPITAIRVGASEPLSQPNLLAKYKLSTS
jgi:hypothetical protein